MKPPSELVDILNNKSIPEWAIWIAQDGDGTWWAYKAEPLHNNRGWYENEIGLFQKLGNGTPPNDWTSQLYKIESLIPQIK